MAVLASDTRKDIGRGKKAIERAKKVLRALAKWNVPRPGTLRHRDRQHTVFKIDLITESAVGHLSLQAMC